MDGESSLDSVGFLRPHLFFFFSFVAIANLLFSFFHGLELTFRRRFSVDESFVDFGPPTLPGQQQRVDGDERLKSRDSHSGSTFDSSSKL